ncbi:MAG: 5'/3'-nucleotidase SurE [Spirochaetales bacterium]|uniref:5'-nucleotidase SurE n=1 Tax=Candidatus Thalassospirochaeta sargassi TaxID=3119039 RepID=A0AAJ1ICI2_9SPIO|nr:5'/3'-nucleotidase SurE [Spirochaetales bacterium]
MRILLTNDDGIKSPGLDALRETFKEHEVWVVAPVTQQSGKSHSVTFMEPVRFNQLEDQVFSVEGSPADCVMYSVLGALPQKPDLVISGINIGANLGTDLIYSGTAAAARQAALMGLPGIAVSTNSFVAPFYFQDTAEFIKDNIELLLSLWRPDHFINVNTPNQPEFPSEVRITAPSRRIYEDKVVRFDAPRGGSYFFLEGSSVTFSGTDSDSEAIAAGAVSVSPIFLHPQNRDEAQAYQKAEFRIN